MDLLIATTQTIADSLLYDAILCPRLEELAAARSDLTDAYDYGSLISNELQRLEIQSIDRPPNPPDHPNGKRKANSARRNIIKNATGFIGRNYGQSIG